MCQTTRFEQSFKQSTSLSYEKHSLVIGEDVVIGHSAVVHGCEIEDGALVGIGARVLDGAVVEERAQVGAGAVVPPGMRVPAETLVLGIPARVARPLNAVELAANAEVSQRYVELKERWALETGYGVGED